MKKVLSFVLSVAMVICLMPAMAFADGEDAAPTTTATATGLSQFSDADSINKKEAVAVLVGLGIVDGMGDGTFQPAGDLTRAQASKLVATLVKSGDKSDIPAPAADPFTDVAKSYWGAGAIKFGVDNGYINGMGDGTFHPEDQVTTAQLATMLDKLLGYSVADINYQWPENAMAKATTAGLLKGITKGANDNLNREEAAQMIFNALKANTKVKSTTTGSDSQLVDGGSGYENVPNKESDDYRTYGKDTVQQLIEKYFPKVVYDSESTGDAFERPATVWKNGRTKITDELTRVPVLTYTDQEVSTSKPLEKASDELKSDLDGYGVNTYTITEEYVNPVTGGISWIDVVERGTPVYVNGELVKDIDVDNSDAIAKILGLEYSGNGVLIEIYANDKDTQITRVVVADYEFHKVKKVDSKTGEITLDNDMSIVKKDDFYSAVSSVSRDEFVLIAANSDDEIVDAYLPEAVDGSAITKIKTSTKEGLEDAEVTAGGKVYTIGHHGVGGDGLEVNANDKGTVYLDKYGYMVGYKKANETAADWALLKSVYTVSATNDFGEESEDYYGLIIKEDGTVDTIPLLFITDPDDDNYKASATTKSVVAQFKALEGVKLDEGGHNWFATKEEGNGGLLVTYKEAAAGYKLNTEDRDINYDKLSDGVVGSSVNAPDKDSKDLDGIYLSGSLSVVTVSGDKASTVKTSTASKISTQITGTYQYVWKKIGNNTLVTTIFRTGVADDSTSIYVDKLVGPTTYGTGDSKGYEITYYTDDSAEPQTGIISEDSFAGGVVRDGSWYRVKEIKEGMTLNPLSGSKYKEKTVEYGDEETTAYQSSMKIDGQTYVLAEDATVVDLAETDITTVEALVDEIAKITAEENNDPIRVSFTWKEDGEDLVVSQIYLEEVPK